MKINDLFILYQGNGFELYNMSISEKTGVNFVSRTSQNNGVVAKVEQDSKMNPFKAGLITVALGGSVLSSFVQTKPFYTAFHIMVLEPKRKMSFNEKLYYCMCINKNAYRYNYGRQANKTLKDIEIPDNVPEWAKELSVNPISTNVKKQMTSLNYDLWREFLMSDLFVFVKGKRLTRADMIPGSVNFLGAISENNGIREKITTDIVNAPNCINVNYNGSVGEAFYQSEPFWASDDVNILYAKNWDMNKYNALFLITVIKTNKYRFSYGHKWTLEKMKATILKLPATDDGTNPDFEYMEQFIKSLPYSDKI